MPHFLGFMVRNDTKILNLSKVLTDFVSKRFTSFSATKCKFSDKKSHSMNRPLQFIKWVMCYGTG